MPEELAVKVAEIDQRSKSNTHRLDKVERRQDNLDRLVSSVAAMATEQEHIKADVTEIKADVKTLAEKPGKRWEAIVEKAIMLVGGAVIGYMLMKIGLG